LDLVPQSVNSVASGLRQFQRGGWTSGITRTSFGSRQYKLWVPAGLDPQKPLPLVLMLHGCTQRGEDLAEISGMNAIADREGFLVVYPEQSRRANFLKCWNWFEAHHQVRGAGEPAILAGVIREIRNSYNVDADRVYVTGVSAGGAMAIVMGATYPDLFSAIGAFAGVEFKAAISRTSAFGLLRHGAPDPGRQGRLAFEAMSAGLRERPRARMPVIVFQGSNDHRVPRGAAGQVIAQWAETNACMAAGGGKKADPLIEQVHEGSVTNGYTFTRHIYSDGDGLLMEKWIVHGLGHAWSGSPQLSRYGDPKGPDASAEIWRFFCETSTASSRPPNAGRR
jgi:poly(hydroxyalkanoate) depolymerase family esterase